MTIKCFDFLYWCEAWIWNWMTIPTEIHQGNRRNRLTGILHCVEPDVRLTQEQPLQTRVSTDFSAWVLAQCEASSQAHLWLRGMEVPFSASRGWWWPGETAQSWSWAEDSHYGVPVLCCYEVHKHRNPAWLIISILFQTLQQAPNSLPFEKCFLCSLANWLKRCFYNFVTHQTRRMSKIPVSHKPD